jgi:integrase
MASVRLKKNSEHWFACYKVPTGKLDARGLPVFRRVQRSTGTDDKERAQQMAISFERAAVAAAEKRWSERAGRRLLSELSALTGVSVAEVEPAGDFLRRWVNGRKATLGAASFTKYSDTVRDFMKFIGEGVPLADITPKRVADFRDADTVAGKAPATVNKNLMILRQAFSEATAQGLFTTNPADGLNVKGAKKAAQKRSAYTFEQFRELVRVTAPDYRPPSRTTWKNHTLDPDWQTLVMLCGYTGARQQEAAQLDWAQVELDSLRMTLERSKTKDTHWLPLHPSLAAHLRGRWERAGKAKSGPVLPHLSTVQRRRISNEFRRSILPRVGIVQEFATGNGKGRKLAAYSIHSLRHSLATWLQQAGVEESMRMQLIGHEDERVNRGYTHTQLTQAATALGKVPSL